MDLQKICKFIVVNYNIYNDFTSSMSAHILSTFRFKLHKIINDKGEIRNFMFAPGNIDDRESLDSESFNKEGLCGNSMSLGVRK